MEKGISCKWKGKKAGVAVRISDKIGFKIKAVVRDREGHYLMIKGTIPQEDITLVNPSMRVRGPAYMRSPETKRTRVYTTF